MNKKKYNHTTITLSAYYLDKLIQADRELNNGELRDQNKIIAGTIELFDKQNIKQIVLNKILIQELCFIAFLNEGMSHEKKTILNSLLNLGLNVDKSVSLIVALHAPIHKNKGFSPNTDWLKWVEKQSPQSIYCTSFDLQNNQLADSFDISLPQKNKHFTILDLVLLYRAEHYHYSKPLNGAQKDDILDYLIQKNCNALLSDKVSFAISKNTASDSPFWKYVLYNKCEKHVLQFLFSKIYENNISQELKRGNLFVNFFSRCYPRSGWIAEYQNHNPQIKNTNFQPFSEIEEFFENKNFEVFSKFGTLRWIIENQPQFLFDKNVDIKKDFLTANERSFLIETFNDPEAKDNPTIILHLIKLLKDYGAQLKFFAFHPGVPKNLKPYFEQIILDTQLHDVPNSQKNKLRL